MHATFDMENPYHKGENLKKTPKIWSDKIASN